MAIIKNTKRRLSNTDDKAFNVNNIESYHLDKTVHLFKGGLIIRIKTAWLDQLIKLVLEISTNILIANTKKNY